MNSYGIEGVSDEEVRTVIKLIDIEIGDLIASGPAADWPELDQSIWILVNDGFCFDWDDPDGRAKNERIIKALAVLNRIENGS